MDTIARSAMFIDGDCVDTEDRFEIRSPATEELVASVARGGREHADRAIAAAMWKIGPALAAGNTIVVKPDEHTPLTLLEFARIAQECGLPPGVLNVVPGEGPVVGARLG